MSQKPGDPGLTDPSIAIAAADPQLIAGTAPEHQVLATARGFPVLLTALVSFSALSVDLILPALPNLITYFKSDVPTAQLTVSVFIIGFAFGQLAYGSLSDKFGRRRVLLAGLALYFVASLACTLADSIEQLIVGRFFQALGACSGIVVGRACATNPVSIVVPCHRAVREDGGLGGYRWGLPRKEKLLAIEAKRARR